MKKIYNSYKKSGVNMATADKLVNYISKISRKTYKKNTETKSFKNIGSFGSIFDLSQYKMNNPLIVSSTDGVGTKIEMVNEIKQYNTIGIDLVAMCVNDLIVQGAKPIFFLLNQQQNLPNQIYFYYMYLAFQQSHRLLKHSLLIYIQ